MECAPHAPPDLSVATTNANAHLDKYPKMVYVFDNARKASSQTYRVSATTVQSMKLLKMGDVNARKGTAETEEYARPHAKTEDT